MDWNELKKVYLTPYEHLAELYLDAKEALLRFGEETREDLEKTLSSFTRREKLYKRYFEVKSDPVETDHFFRELEKEDILSYGLQFPEHGLTFKAPEAKLLPEQMYFSSQYLFDVAFLKHPRYSPLTFHRHTFYEAIYVLEGEIMHYVDSVPLAMGKGDFCLISPNMSHTVSAFSDNAIAVNLQIRQTTFVNIFYGMLRGENVLTRFFLDTVRDHGLSNYVLFHTGENASVREAFLDMFLEFRRKRTYYSEILNSSLLTFFARLLREHEQDCELSSAIDQEELRGFALVQYIRENVANTNLDQLARWLHYSKEYTSRLVRQETGYTFSQLLMRARMEQAASLLTNTSLPETDICTVIGYQNPEHFSRLFKKAYGMPPKEYRKRFYKTEGQ